MNVFSIIVLRLLISIKWFVQSFGVLLSFFIFFDYDSAEFIALVSAIIIIIPELIMGFFIWIFRGACSVSKKNNTVIVPIFGKPALLIAFIHYLAIFCSLGLIIGLFMGIPLVCSGLVLIICSIYRRGIKKIIEVYLEIYC